MKLDYLIDLLQHNREVFGNIDVYCNGEYGCNELTRLDEFCIDVQTKEYLEIDDTQEVIMNIGGT